ncbi:DMT family transporter [Pedomonas mirosovicensis]|uniref:DMT family transporter n=1 Tax=Pedomonas mirosovicensis TaxID=2908641 RepID=UPI0035BC3B7B
MTITGGLWRPGLVVGTLFALEYLFVGEGLRFTNASRMAIFLYTAPIFAALGLHWKLPTERLKPLQWGGILLAFLGIIVTFAGKSGAADSHAANRWIGDLLGLAAGMSLGATTVAIRFSRLSNASATVTLQYQLIGAFVILLVSAFALGQTQVRFTAISLGSLAFQSIIVSFLSFIVWFALLRVYLASRLGVLSFMTPLFGIGFGVWLLHEPLEFSFAIGSAMVLAGILMVSGHKWLRQSRKPVSA